jgi:alpha-L-fucosidase
MGVHYEPTLESLRRHPVPDWYHDAKLGIFIHWSLSSVPGFATREHDITELLRERPAEMNQLSPYSEWYENSLKFPDSPAAKYHRERYGGRPYAEFREAYEKGLERWRPDLWAERFAAAGARYVVLVTKHHDGYTLWPSRVANPRRPGWACPRDLVGELAAAVRARGMKFGVYYSAGLDWTFDGRRIGGIGDLMAAIPLGDYPAYADAQMRELIERVRPDVLWNDIAWPGDQASFYRLVADYYNAVPEGVINDRWIAANWLTRAMKLAPVRIVVDRVVTRAVRKAFEKPDAKFAPPLPPHYDARTPEYAVFAEARPEKWECVRGMDKSFGYNRMSRPEDFLSREALVHSLADITSKNGNLLLNVGPRGEDAAIPEPQLERLGWLASFTSRAGEALYGTRPWRRAEGATAEGIPVRFTQRGGTLYALLLGRPAGDSVMLRDVTLPAGARARLLGGPDLTALQKGTDLFLHFPAPLPDEPAHAIALASAA